MFPLKDRTEKQKSRAKELENAWIGDAVLALWARLQILKKDGRLDGEKSTRMTSNQFLSAFGEPTKVEAEIGTIFLEQGLEQAFRYLDEQLLPLFERHERKWLTRQPKRRRTNN
jgi:dsRNA-specific ribonuclease